MNKLATKLARIMQHERAYNEGRMISRVSEFTEYDKEEIEIMRSQLFNLFYHSNGRKWDNVLKDIKAISGFNFHLGFGAQQTIIDTCAKYGFVFTL